MGQPVVHFEVIGKDGEKLQRFYGELFDWEIDARGQGVPPQRVPVERAVDRRRGLLGHVSHVGGTERRFVIPVLQGGESDAPVGRAAGVGRIIDIAALLGECEGEASVEQVSHRLFSIRSKTVQARACE